MPPEVDFSRSGDLVIAQIDGEIDISNVGRLTERLLESVPNEAQGLVVDLAAARYVDSAGVRMLFDLVRQLHTGRQGLAVVVPDRSPVRRLVTMTKLHEVAVLRASVSDAVAALRESLDQPL